MEDYDVAIAGGGPAGASAAIVLARAGRRVLLADAGPAGRFRVGEGLPPAAHALLRDLRVLDQFIADGHRTSFGNLCLWGCDEAIPTDFLHDKWGCGYQLDRIRFDAMLLAAAVVAGVVVHVGGRIILQDNGKEDIHGSRVRLVHDGQHQSIACPWLIDASGRSASLARRLGAVRRREDKLVGVTMLLRATPDATADADGRTLVEACEGGWWYSALLPCGDRIVTYLTDFDLVDRTRVRRSDCFWSQLMATRMLSSQCAKHGYRPVGSVHISDASTGVLDISAGENWLAVGEAALSFDPLSSQGITTAIHTGIRGAQAVDAALHGARHVVSEYRAHVAAIHHTYLTYRRLFYSMERQWPQSLFWRRRHSIVQGPQPHLCAA